jgi:hypothetical protein
MWQRRKSWASTSIRTRFGRLDVLKEAGGETYETLRMDATDVDAEGHTILRFPALR